INNSADFSLAPSSAPKKREDKNNKTRIAQSTSEGKRPRGGFDGGSKKELSKGKDKDNEEEDNSFEDTCMRVETLTIREHSLKGGAMSPSSKIYNELHHLGGSLMKVWGSLMVMLCSVSSKRIPRKLILKSVRTHEIKLEMDFQLIQRGHWFMWVGESLSHIGNTWWHETMSKVYIGACTHVEVANSHTCVQRGTKHTR
ncbi:hypothetical protein PanWU01x14_284000, partial [Parasponia andersonii]